MYFPSSVPISRLSYSTSFTPLGPSSQSRPSTPYRTPGRPNKGKFSGGGLGGVQEEEGEQILSITRGPSPSSRLWAVLAREEFSVWVTTPKVVLAKLKRTPISLRNYGSNSTISFHGEDRIVVTTTTGHTLLYEIHSVNEDKRKNGVYVLPGGDKARQVWPRGSGEGNTELQGILLKGSGERSIQVGDGVGW